MKSLRERERNHFSSKWPSSSRVQGHTMLSPPSFSTNSSFWCSDIVQGIGNTVFSHLATLVHSTLARESFIPSGRTPGLTELLCWVLPEGFPGFKGQAIVYVIESPNYVWDSDRLMASTKGYSYDKGSGLFIAKRGCVSKLLSFKFIFECIRHPLFPFLLLSSKWTLRVRENGSS